MSFDRRAPAGAVTEGATTPATCKRVLLSEPPLPPLAPRTPQASGLFSVTTTSSRFPAFHINGTAQHTLPPRLASFTQHDYFESHPVFSFSVFYLQTRTDLECQCAFYSFYLQTRSRSSSRSVAPWVSTAKSLAPRRLVSPPVTRAAKNPARELEGPLRSQKSTGRHRICT